MEYRKEIDGLRAVAVLPVILFHAGFSLFSGGYIGVDVFFVISGYLITSILIKDFDQGSFSILKFYERRARRILPALFFVMICCIPFAYAWMLPQQYKDFSQALVAVSFFGSNFLFWKKTDYFSPNAEENPLLHTWSLAVEEQFYVFFPLIILLLWKFGKKPLFYTVFLLSVFSFILSEWSWRNFPVQNFYLLPTRAWELGAGALCALILTQNKINSNSYLSLLGLIMVVFSIFIYSEATPFPSAYTLVPVIGTTLIILFSGSCNLSYKILANKLFVGIGTISFSIYLWHQPLFAFAKIRSPFEPSLNLMLILSFASILLAVFSWKYIEQPFRNKRMSFSRKSIFVYSVSGTIFFIILGLYGHINIGLPNRTAPSGSTFAELKVEEQLQVNNGLSPECEGEFTTTAACRTGDEPVIMVWGDSFAMHLVPAILSSQSLKDKKIIQFTKSSCSPIVNLALTNHMYTKSWSSECIGFNRSVIEWMSKNDSVKYVVMSSPLGIYNSYTYDEFGQLHRPSKTLVLKKLNQTAKYIRSFGKEPIFISPPPRTGEDLSSCAIYNSVFTRDNHRDCSFSLNNVSPTHMDVISLLQDDRLSIPVVMLEDYICSDEICNSSAHGSSIFRDAGHLSHYGSSYLGKKADLVRVVTEKAWTESISSSNASF